MRSYAEAAHDRENPVLGTGSLDADALRAANINPDTGLATDYLNHFNEVVMLMEMLPDMPDCAEDILEWVPADYSSHFANSTFKDKDLAVRAYEASPRAVRVHLETLICQLDSEILNSQTLLRQTNDAETLASIAHIATHEIKPLISAASGTIHGQTADEPLYADDTAQAQIDALFQPEGDGLIKT